MLSTNSRQRKEYIYFPVEVYPESSTADVLSKDQGCGTDYSSMANTALIFYGPTDETVSDSDNLSTGKMEDDRLAIIMQKRKLAGMDEEVVEFLKHAHWKKTNRVLQFLIDNRNYSATHLNGLKSAIASVFKILHPQKLPLASQEVILELFQAKRKTEITIPTQEQLVTWDTDVICNFIKSRWLRNDQPTLQDIQLKTITISTSTLHFTAAKKNQRKSTQLGVIQDTTLCPTRILFDFVERTKHQRSTLPSDHTFFLTYLDKKKETISVRPSTVANWLPQVMSAAGIDPFIYKPYSIRSIASTKPVERGNTIQTVKRHANWSLRSDTLERYHFKPVSQQSESTNTTRSIFHKRRTIPHWTMKRRRKMW
ncbi:MAG: hypothetical protein EXX96DRAFT_597429 [Benjaminiella poitrasii]|nr:MAG: hypothetical protein EXX96DRAFT_597429 [Benjaminiella poitrasii]